MLSSIGEKKIGVDPRKAGTIKKIQNKNIAGKEKGGKKQVRDGAGREKKEEEGGRRRENGKAGKKIEKKKTAGRKRRYKKMSTQKETTSTDWGNRFFGVDPGKACTRKKKIRKKTASPVERE
jgi:hypothetical protein